MKQNHLIKYGSRHKILTKSRVHRNNNPKDKKRTCWGLKPNRFHAESPAKAAASCRFLSIEPKVVSTGDRSDAVSIPFSFNSSNV